ncbi:hypothetical protein IE81DRAFT_245080 [Ceraceosorus guamensis]|uniref:Uncharacterized protein n=1 Tax=Ceraceosorus guamensis TaxID=1522189 RepID=A0A316VR71_9BASI|nr:hypothetical protein IE81DRAFT_245080 [Ceraceosorus guamensis]PWN40107.1 hypothetical protein IE81DRAFT_245080 [Ceraceosorus guamensis]
MLCCPLDAVSSLRTMRRKLRLHSLAMVPTTRKAPAPCASDAAIPNLMAMEASLCPIERMSGYLVQHLSDGCMRFARRRVGIVGRLLAAMSTALPDLEAPGYTSAWAQSRDPTSTNCDSSGRFAFPQQPARIDQQHSDAFLRNPASARVAARGGARTRDIGFPLVGRWVP